MQINNNKLVKWAKGLSRHFSIEDVQKLNMDEYEKIFNITNHQKNIYSNHNEVSPHISKNDCYQWQKVMSDWKDVEKKESFHYVGGDMD